MENFVESPSRTPKRELCVKYFAGKNIVGEQLNEELISIDEHFAINELKAMSDDEYAATRQMKRNFLFLAMFDINTEPPDFMKPPNWTTLVKNIEREIRNADSKGSGSDFDEPNDEFKEKRRGCMQSSQSRGKIKWVPVYSVADLDSYLRKSSNTETFSDSKAIGNDKAALDYQLYQCSVCDEIFKRASVLKTHFRLVHGVVELRASDSDVSKTQGPKVYQPKSLTHTVASNRHVKKISDSLSPTQCRPKQCVGKQSERPTSQLKHRVETADIKFNPKQCDECGKIFTTASTVKLHKITVHKKLQPYDCSICGKRFGISGNLKSHIRTVHHKIRKFECSLCDKTFLFAGHLKTHISTLHDSLKPYQCDLCGKNYGTVSCLFDHTRKVHEKLRPHKCDRCGKGFYALCELQNHISTVHLRQRPFSCDQCGRSFGLAGNLTAHVRAVHKNRRLFSCSFCGKMFAAGRDVRRHAQRVHKKLKPHPCALCEKRFATRSDMKRHVDTVHLKLRPHKCGRCEVTFAASGHLRRHVKVVHDKIKRHKCGHCGKRFSESGHLKAHVNSRHKTKKSL